MTGNCYTFQTLIGVVTARRALEQLLHWRLVLGWTIWSVCHDRCTARTTIACRGRDAALPCYRCASRGVHAGGSQMFPITGPPNTINPLTSVTACPQYCL